MDARGAKRIEVPGKILQELKLEAVDLSETGMKIRTQESYNPGATLKVTLALAQDTLCLQSKIIWCNESRSVFSSNYLMGVQFVGQSISDQLKIRKYIQAQLNN